MLTTISTVESIGHRLFLLFVSHPFEEVEEKQKFLHHERQIFLLNESRSDMSYTELEHGYQDLRSTSRPIFYVGDLNAVQPTDVDPAGSSIYRSSKRGELSDGCSNEDGSIGGSDLEGEGKQVLVGICAMAKKSQSKPMKEILTRLEEFEYIKIIVFPEDVILKEPVEDWPIVDCLISFHSKGFPLDKAIHYANLRNPFIINNLPMQYDIQDRRRVYAILDSEGIEIPRYAVLDRDSADPKHHELVESEDHVEVNGVTFNKPFVEKPVSAEDHNIYIYYPTSAGGGSQRLFRKIGSRSSVYSPESRVRKTGSYIYEDFMPTDGTDVKVYTVGPDYAHAEARKSPALDGKVERDSEGKEIRYPVILSNAEKLISRKVCLAFKQTVCGFDLLRANGKSFVCDVNGFSFVKNSNKYYDDCAKILGNMILRELAPTLHIPWSVPFQLDDPPIVPTTFGKMMELRCVVAVIRHGDRTPKQKMKVEVRHPKFFEIFAKYDGYKHGHVKLKRPKQLQEILDTARSLLSEIQHRAAGPELEEKQGKLEQLKSVLEMYGHFSGINRKVQMKYQPRGRPRGSSSDDGNSHNRLGEPSLVLILKWGGELTPAGRIQAEELGRIFRCMYPGGQGRHLSEEDSEMLPSHGEYAGAQGLGLLRLHSTFRHDLKIYASDEGRVQMTAAAFAKGLLALEGELTPILVQMVKSANTNGLLDNDCDSSKYQNMVKTRLHELLQQDREFTKEDREQINPGNALSINDAMDFVKNPVQCCQHVQMLIQKLMDIVRIKKDDPKTKDAILYHGETWELMGRRWGKIEKDFCTKNKRFDISKIPDIYDCIKYDLQHNNHTLQFDHAEELYIYAKYLADIVIPQEYGLTVQEKLTIGQGICTPLLKKIRADLQRNIEESGEETVNRLNPRYSHGVSSPGRHVRTRLYFTSESHVHSLLTVLRYGGLLDVVTDEQWRRAMEYVSMVSELNYMSQIVVMLYEDPTKDPSSEERFHVELHFSPGVNCCVQKNLPPGPGFRPHSRNESSHNLETTSQCSTRIEEEDAELGVLDDDATISPLQQSDSSPPLIETEEAADSTLDSPTTSRAIDMMDLDPNMMDEPYDSGFLQGSAPIPISARTVAGHEAARLGSQLAASQRQRREREASGICEPRARSYDHQRQDKPEKTADKLQYQSLDAVNKEDDRSSRNFEIGNSFYDRVENYATGKVNSTRNSCDKYSQSNVTTYPIHSMYASSPDLSDRHSGNFEKIVIPSKPREPREETLKERSSPQASGYSRKIPIRREKSLKTPKDRSIDDENDFWDFGDDRSSNERPIPHDDDFPNPPPEFEIDEEIGKPQIDVEIGNTDVPKATSSIKNSSGSTIAFRSTESTVQTIKSARSSFDDREIGCPAIGDRPTVQFTIDLGSSTRIDDPPASSSIEPRTTDFHDSTMPISPKIDMPIDRKSSRGTFKAIASSPVGHNRVMTCSPSYLGIPISLPHSVSSPELPAPLVETILRSIDSSTISRDKSSTSPRSPPTTDFRDRRRVNVEKSTIVESSNLLTIQRQTNETKRYGRSKSALTLPTISDTRGESDPSKNPVENFRPTNDRYPIDTSEHSNSRCHWNIAKIDKNTGKITKIGNKSANAIVEPSIESIGHEKSLNVTNDFREIEIVNETTSLKSTDLSTIDSLNRSTSYHRNRESLTPIDRDCSHSKIPKRSIPISRFQPRRASLNVPDFWDVETTSPNRVTDLPPNDRSRWCPTSTLEIRPTTKSTIDLDRPTIVRSSENQRSNEISHCPKYSTSLPSTTHQKNNVPTQCRSFSIAEVATLNNQKFSNPDEKRSSIRSTNTDHEVLTHNEDLIKRRNHNFSGRSRSLSPCPQRCLCYNCNVAVLIQQSVNLSPAERSNFRTYFIESLSHKFDNCKCYRRSVESAEASRRVSRSASPNSSTFNDSCFTTNFGRPCETLFPNFDVRQCSKFRTDRAIYDDSQKLNREKRLERRQSSPQNIEASSNVCCDRCRLPRDLITSLVNESREKFADAGVLDSRASGIVGQSDNLLSLDSLGPLGGSQVPSNEKSNSSGVGIDDSIPIGNSTFDVDSGSIDVGSIDPESHQNKVHPDSIDFPLSSSSEINDPNNVDPIDNWTLIDDQTVRDSNQSLSCSSSRLGSIDKQTPIDVRAIGVIKQNSCSSLSRQISCPEVVIDSSSVRPSEYPTTVNCQCDVCTREPNKNLPNPTNKFQRLEPNSSGLLTPSMNHLRPHRAPIDWKLGDRLPRQYSCPEIIVESPDRSLSSGHQGFGTSRCSLIEQDFSIIELERSNGLSDPKIGYPDASRSSTRPLCSDDSRVPPKDRQDPRGPHRKNSYPQFRRLNRDVNSNDDVPTTSSTWTNVKTHGKICKIILSHSNGIHRSIHNHTTSSSSPSSHPRLQTQRSFSSPDTRPSIIQEPDPTCTARRHRHSISGQMSYFKLLGYNVSKKLTGSANSLFSTAVISGSSSAPNLKDMVPSHASVVAAIEGFGGVPPIRPLETLHNALSLRQLDSFLDMMTSAPLYRTPASSPPKFPSPGGSVHGVSVIPSRSIVGIGREYHSSDLEAVRYITPTPIHYKPGQDGEGSDIRSQLSPTSPNSIGWSSEPQSFLSSEPSSPAPTSAGECSMSMSLVSNDGTQPFAGPKFSTTPCLDLDFNDFCMSMDRGEDARGESRGSISYTDYYSNEDGLIRKSGPDLAHLRDRASRDNVSQESVVDDDEEHTLTLRQTEEQRKQDVKFIFDRNKESPPNVVKPGSSFKKIGRFRVESMEITDEDVRIKDAAAAAVATAAAAAAAAAALTSSSSNSISDRTKTSSTSINEKSSKTCDKMNLKKSREGFSTPQPRSRHGSKLIARSQSVSTPQNVCHKTDVDRTSQMSSNKTGSFSTMSCEDLENWKAMAVSPPASVVVSPIDDDHREPILTVANSLKGTSNVTIGFNVKQDKKD